MSDRMQIRVGVGVFIQDRVGQILLEKRRDCGLWCLPGGRIEPGESVQNAAIREVQEETGFTVEVTRLIGVYSEAGNRIVEYPDTGRAHLVDIVVGGRIVRGDLRCSAESEAVDFFPAHALPAILPRSLLPIQDGLERQAGAIR